MNQTPEIARPLSEWHEDMGDVLWWRFPVSEVPYVGSPLDCGNRIEIEIREPGKNGRYSPYWIGGWPGYHTHWTPLPPVPSDPTSPGAQEDRSDGKS